MTGKDLTILQLRRALLTLIRRPMDSCRFCSKRKTCAKSDCRPELDEEAIAYA